MINTTLHISSFDTGIITPEALYDEDEIKKVKNKELNFNVYMIVLTPTMKEDLVEQAKKNVMSDESFKECDEGFLKNQIQKEINKMCHSKVLYVGQSYGKEGGRHPIDRLKKHEKLQEILIKEKTNGYHILILLIGIQNERTNLICINPTQEKVDAKKVDKATCYTRNVIDKDLISLYEAGLIKYFEPKYNKDFKSNFPSNNLKTSVKIYSQEYSFLSLSLRSDIFPNIYSDKIEEREEHNIYFDLKSNKNNEKIISEKEYIFRITGIRL